MSDISEPGLHQEIEALRAERDALREAGDLILRGYERMRREAPKQVAAMRSRSEHGWEDFSQGLADLRAVARAERKP